MIPKNPGVAKNYAQKSGNSPKKVPKNLGATSKSTQIMAHSRIATYASYPPPPPEGSIYDWSSVLPKGLL